MASFPDFDDAEIQFTPGQIGGHIAAFMLTMGLLCPFVIKLSSATRSRNFCCGDR
ncbi:MAG: hypothetical protein IPP40_09185 [bacterium]|nr:hypothetical protein [bacterium]